MTSSFFYAEAGVVPKEWRMENKHPNLTGRQFEVFLVNIVAYVAFQLAKAPKTPNLLPGTAQ